MTVHPRKGFETVVSVIDAINPFLVVLSIVGLFFEFTTLKRYVIPVNQVIDLLFVADFVTRLICFPSGKYFVKGYGWIDFLASLPGLTLLLSYTPVFGAFKFVRIGRFFKIIRILRFLRVFQFLKNMRSDSIWIQDRIMKIGISIVLVFVGGIFVTDTITLNALSELKGAAYHQLYKQGVAPQEMVASHPQVLYYTSEGKIYDRQDRLVEPKVYEAAVNDQVDLSLEFVFHPESPTTAEGYRIPMESILVASPEVSESHDNVMLTLISTLVVLLLILMFYVGFLFAKDMKTVQLINDSIDAEDYLLLNEQVKAQQDSHGQLVLGAEDDELAGLLKMVGKLTLERAQIDYPGGLPAPSEGPTGELEARLDRIERLAQGKDDRILNQKQLRAIIRETTLETLAALKKKG